MLALHMFPETSGQVWRNLTSLSGLGLILFAGFAYSDSTPFPGLAAVVPCLGAALIICSGKAGNETLTSRFLASRPLVLIGVISYSLYLWHWPIIVFSGLDPNLSKGMQIRWFKVLLLLAAVAAGALSWKFVETPVRFSRSRPSRAVLFRLVGAGVLATTLLSVGVFIFRGFPGRWPAEALRVASYLKYTHEYMREGTCFVGEENERFDATRCLQDVPGKKTLLLVGDSHAADLWYGLSATLRDVNLMQATASRCKPVMEEARTIRALDRISDQFGQCRNLMEFVYKDYLPKNHLNALLISASWDKGDFPELSRTLNWVTGHGVKVVLFGPKVEYDLALPRLLALSIRDMNPNLVSAHRIVRHDLDKDMASLTERYPGVRYVSLIEALCGGESCLDVSEGVPLEFDSGHYTKEGSLLVAQRIQINGAP
jgi:hypothetical protein